MDTARYTALVRVSEALRTYHEPEVLFRELARELRPVVRFSFLGLALFDEHTGEVTPHVLEATGESAEPPLLTSCDQLTHHVIAQQQPLVIPSVETESRFAPEMTYLREQGARSICCLPLTTSRRKVGMLLAGSREAHEYNEDDIGYLSLVANQVALAIDDALTYDALQASLALERDRLRALNASEALLRAISPALDVADVFQQVSEIARQVVPHDMAALILIAPDREHVVLHAIAGGALQPATTVAIDESMKSWLTESWDFKILDDVQGDPKTRHWLTARAGFRGAVRLALRDGDQLIAMLQFASRQPHFYNREMALAARRIADHVALALSHHRLAEERERGAKLRERTANLEVLDGLLSTLTGVLSLKDVFDRVSAIAQKVLAHDALIVVRPTGDADRARVYAIRGFGDVPHERETRLRVSVFREHPWDYRIIDDISIHPDWKDSMSVKAGLKSALSLPIHRDDTMVAMVTFVARQPNHFTKDDVLIARRIADHMALALSHEDLAIEHERVAKLRERTANLEVLDGLLAALTGALSLKEVLDRVSEIAQTVIEHDALSVLLMTDDPHVARVYAVRGFGDISGVIEAPLRGAELATAQWDHRLIDDLRIDPEYEGSQSLKLGHRSALLMPIRLEGRAHAIVSFQSMKLAHFSKDDVMIARRIVDHMALALSHERLAEEQRRNETLQARDASLDLLDEVVAGLAESGQLPEVWDRISNAAQKVLAHDALLLAALLPDGIRGRVYASRTSGSAPFSEYVSVPPTVINNPSWEYDLVQDLQSQADQKHLESTRLGYRAALRIPLRLDGEFVAALSFMSFTPSAYSLEDVRIARRIGDRLLRSFARERRHALMKRANEASERVSRLESRVQELTEELDSRTGYRRVVGQSLPWKHVLTQATQVAATDTTALLLGESGTGKEVVARFLHRASTRNKGPFVALNCAALPEQLLEAELFGYERGAFTGAVNSKPGQLEQAAGGTLFLDEVGEMSMTAQAKFLRVLQEREFQRLGGTRVLKSDARIIAATNRDLAAAIRQGQFREDLFYRLNVFAINLPPLRDRREDVLPLSEAFLLEIGKSLGYPPGGISRDAREKLVSYHWPGNVRELRNILERAAILCEGGLITTEHLTLLPVVPASRPAAAEPAMASVPAAASAPPASGDIASVERSMIEQALKDSRFNKSKAAKQLGLTRTQLYIRLKRYGLE